MHENKLDKEPPKRLQRRGTMARKQKPSLDGAAMPAMNPIALPVLPQLLNVKQVARWFNVNVNTVRRMVNEKEIPAIRIGPMYRFDAKDVQTALEKKKGH